MLLALGLAAAARGPAPAVPAVNAPAGTASEPPPLTVALPPAAPDDAVRKLLLQSYADATHTSLTTTSWDGATLDGLKQPVPDLALVTGPQLLAGCKSQFFLKLDWKGADRDRYRSGAAADCGAGAYQTATVLAWDSDKVATPPNWGDFWDVARRPGRRGLPRSPRPILEIALLADGVAPGDIYRTLRSPDGLDRAFRKLDQLKPYILWWDQPAQAAQLLSDGKVLFVAAPASAVQQAASGRHHFGVQWAGSLSEWRYFAVPKDTPRQGPAQLLLQLAADPARQALFAQASLLGPAVRDAVALLPAASRDRNPAAHQDGMFAVDDGFWADGEDKLDPRFATWISK